MELQKLIYTVEDGIGIVTMNYLKNLNAIDEQMADELMYVVEAAEKDPNVKVLVVKSAGKAFSAGGDIGYFYQLIQARRSKEYIIKKGGCCFSPLYIKNYFKINLTFSILFSFVSSILNINLSVSISLPS